MSLIVKQEERQLKLLKDQITLLQQDLRSRLPLDEWTAWNKKTQDNLCKAENLITSTKRNKFERDQLDYDNDRVYSWAQDREKKIY